jgi:hypothetical protein
MVKFLLACLILSGCAAKQSPTPIARTLSIPPLDGLKVIRQRCSRCHCCERPPAGLNLATQDGMFIGGSHGPAVVPLNSQDSLIWQAVSGIGTVRRMPPDATLTVAELAAIKRWIDVGAPIFNMAPPQWP